MDAHTIIMAVEACIIWAAVLYGSHLDNKRTYAMSSYYRLVAASLIFALKDIDNFTTFRCNQAKREIRNSRFF